jgi:hypothetical protein
VDVLTSGGQRRLRMRDDSRGRVIHALSAGRVIDALSAGNPSISALNERLRSHAESDDRIIAGHTDADDEEIASAWLRAFLRGSPPPLDHRPVAQLRGALRAREALHQIELVPPGVPDIDECRRHFELTELIEPLRILVGQSLPGEPDRFARRQTELRKLRGFVDVLRSEGAIEMGSRWVSRSARSVSSTFGFGQTRLLTMSARGGLGKSTLLAKFVLDHAVARHEFPFVYLDFDRATIRGRTPEQLLIETARQLGLSFPKYQPELERLSDALRGVSATATPATDLGEAGHLLQIISKQILADTQASTFLLVLDTMEVVQNDSEAMDDLVEFLNALIGLGFPELAVVAAGRAEIPELTDSGAREKRDPLPWSVTKEELGPLSVGDAVDMVNLLGRALILSWHPAWAHTIAGAAKTRTGGASH